MSTIYHYNYSSLALTQSSGQRPMPTNNLQKLKITKVAAPFEASKMEEFGRKNPTTSIIVPVQKNCSSPFENSFNQFSNFDASKGTLLAIAR